MNPASTALHEANHCAVALELGRRVKYVWRGIGHSWPGETVGHARIPVGEKIEPSQVCIAVSGYMSDDDPSWPPKWEDAKSEPLEALGLVIEKLGINEDQYDDLVDLTGEILSERHVRRLRDCIARTLCDVPRLDAEDLAAICAIYNVVVPEEEPTPC